MRDFANACLTSAAYPLKLLSRTLPAARTSKLRVSWFVLGVACGAGGTHALAPVLPDAPGLWRNATLVVSEAVGKFEDILTTTLPQAKEDAAIEPEGTSQTANIKEPGKEPAATDEPATSYPLELGIRVQSGDTLISVLTDSGVSYEEAQSVALAVRKLYNTRRMNVGKNIEITLDKTPEDTSRPVVSSMVLPLSAVSTVELKRDPRGNFDVRKVDAPVTRKLARAGGRIESSLYETGIASGIPSSLLGEIINAYSYDVDFQRDIHRGDQMDILFERMETKDGALAGTGNIVFAELDLGERSIKLYRHVDKDGNADYYTEKGESVRKALLRTPINGAKITSGYGMRNHPLLGYTRMHRGVDFGAPMGTPIYASGDGKVEFVGIKAGYGNYLKIAHNDKYASAYGHISRFASNIKQGAKVKQGQVVAYVGMTGMATGPHLHYEIMVNNEQVNPAGVKFKTGNVLAGKELAAFRKTIESVQRQLASIPRGSKVAMADSSERFVAN